ncbi:HAD domain-containing protein [Tuberibacillus calidus]|jgi:hypothetical protein|uniref:HAD domain-containing protein n=1 Tax=Tuberibacillus calidus TaxID=340097 RepID=UPI00041AD5CE|nr:HAD domain-containing protein [Tuberibacillus calidus]
MDKIVFLDFNGVMMCGKHPFPSKHHEGFEFYPKSVENLKEIIQATKAKIVVTSTYRKMYAPEQLKTRFFKPYGLEEAFKGITSSLGSRGEEIKHYIEKHDIQHFVIIDDLPINGFGRHFLRTNGFEGISDWIKKEAILILGGQFPENFT